MEQKQYTINDLKQIRVRKKEVERLRIKYDYLKSTYKTPSYSFFIDNNSSANHVENKLLKIIELEKEYYDALYNLERDILNITKIVFGLNNGYSRLLISYYYLDGKRLEEISCILNYSYIHIKRLHKQAIKDFIRPQ